MEYSKIKRMVDLLVAGLALALLLPVFVVIGVAIRLDSPGPILFRQKRVGIYKSHFMILKFRTMYVKAPRDKATHLLDSPEKYITKVGHFLRRTSLDELPQLINIVKGDMSFVGPRPALWNQQDLIAERDKYGANDVRPGLTGWAQVNGRDELEIPQKAGLDGIYVKKLGPLMDLRCILKTFVGVLQARGVREGKRYDR